MIRRRWLAKLCRAERGRAQRRGLAADVIVPIGKPGLTSHAWAIARSTSNSTYGNRSTLLRIIGSRERDTHMILERVSEHRPALLPRGSTTPPARRFSTYLRCDPRPSPRPPQRRRSSWCPVPDFPPRSGRPSHPRETPRGKSAGRQRARDPSENREG